MTNRHLGISRLTCWYLLLSWFLILPRLLVGQEATTESALAIPETNEGLPGDGPIRRYDWFKNLWLQKRTGWAKLGDRDLNAVVFFGDSITQGWGDDFSGHFEGMKKANRGISGDTTRGMLIRMQEDVLTLKPSAVVLLMGTNDLEEGADPETIAGNFKLIINELKQHNSKMPIILCEVFPSSASKRRPADKIQRVNQFYAKIVEGDSQVRLVETYPLFANEQGDAKVEEFPDLLHPNAEGYQKWASALVPVFNELGLFDSKPANP